MSITSGLIEWRRNYQISPIILVGGIAESLPGGVMPIISLLQSADFSSLTGSLDSASSPVGLFEPLPGATMIDNQVGTYPFANQSVAANAIITQPLGISLVFNCPVNTPGGYQQRPSLFSNLQAQLAKHTILGGVYNIATPAMLYTNCLMTRLQDVTDGDGLQVQVKWRFDFMQPLLTLEAAREAQNSLMRKISNGTETAGDPPSASGVDGSVGNSSSLQGPSAIPAAQPLSGASGSGGYSQ